MPFVSLDRRADGVALVQLDRPKANALSVALLEELAETASALHVHPPGAVVLWGGPRIFAAGADIAEFGGADAARRVGRHFLGALDTWAAIPRLTTAACPRTSFRSGPSRRWRARCAGCRIRSRRS